MDEWSIDSVYDMPSSPKRTVIGVSQRGCIPLEGCAKWTMKGVSQIGHCEWQFRRKVQCPHKVISYIYRVTGRLLTSYLR